MRNALREEVRTKQFAEVGMLKSVAVGILVVMFFLTAGLGSLQAQEKKIVAKLGDMLSADHPHTRTWVYFAKKVAEKTKGKVEVQVYDNGQLGSQKDMYLGMQIGTLEMGKIPFPVATEWVPQCKIFDLPYLFNSRDELLRVSESPAGKKYFNDLFLKQGLVGLIWVDDGVRSIYTPSKPIRRVEDMKGMKIRVPGSDIMIETINALGGIGTALGWAELYMALQQKIIDGAENCPVLFYTSKHWEVCRTYSLTEHFWILTPAFASKKWWDSLPKEIQVQISEAALDAEKYFIKIYTEDENNAIDRLKEKGVHVIADVDRPAFRNKVQPVYDNYMKKYGRGLLDMIRDASKKK